MVRVVVTPISSEPAIAGVERAAGVRPERAVWEFGHWLLGTPASGRRPRISTEGRRWVVVPGAGCQEVAADADTELVGAQMLATSGVFQVAVRPGFATVALMWWALFLGVSAAVSAGVGRWDWGVVGWVPVASTLLMLAGLLVHELGHVAAAMAIGDRWMSLRLGADGPAVQFWPPAHRGWRCLVRSLSGPVVHLAYSAVLLLPAMGEDLATRLLWGPPGLFGILLALFQLLPIAGMDGARALAGIRSTPAH